MKPTTHTVQQLFEQVVRYEVPLYQRPYVWEEEQQWAPLWDDLVALLDRDPADTAVQSHFLGALVLEQEPTPPGQIPRYVVIDGQQRLTTLQVLLAAAAVAMAAAGLQNDSDLLRELVINNPKRASGDERFKVWPTNANRAAYRAVIAAEGNPAASDGDGGRIIEAFGYFRTKVSAYLTPAAADLIANEETDDSLLSSEARALTTADRATRLRVALTDLLKVVSITLDGDDNAQVIFETLNARGTPLLALDLVKNAVFHLLTQQRSQTVADELYEDVWQPELERDVWRENRRQGRLFRPAGELFLMHWLTMRLERLVPATELFPTFRQHVLVPGVDAEALVRELCSDAGVMRSFDVMAAGSPEAVFFERFGPLDAGTFLPLILLLFRSHELTVPRRRRALKLIESWLARRALMRLTAKNYNRIAPRLVSEVKRDAGRADDVILAFLTGGAGEISRWPTDAEFGDFLRTYPVYGVVGQPRLVMALAAVERSLYSGKTDVPLLAASLSLEHLLPQHWATYWPLPGDLDGEQLERATAERQERLHRLGNLTIVTQELNASLSNGPWEDKKRALNRESKLLINARLEEAREWTTESIDRRGRWLADRLTQIWPGPGSEAWSG